MNLNCFFDEDFPELHPDEHAWIEQHVGKKLTSREAQICLRDARTFASFEVWIATKKFFDNKENL